MASVKKQELAKLLAFNVPDKTACAIVYPNWSDATLRANVKKTCEDKEVQALVEVLKKNPGTDITNLDNLDGHIAQLAMIFQAALNAGQYQHARNTLAEIRKIRGIGDEANDTENIVARLQRGRAHHAKWENELKMSQPLAQPDKEDE